MGLGRMSVMHSRKPSVEDVVVERSNGSQSESWLTQALNKKRERFQTESLHEQGENYTDAPSTFPEQNQSDQQGQPGQQNPKDTHSASFEEWATLKVRPRRTPAPEPNGNADAPIHEQSEIASADVDQEQASPQTAEEAITPPPDSSSDSSSAFPPDRPVLGALVTTLIHQFDEHSQGLDHRIDQLDTLFSAARQDEQEQLGRLDSTLSNLQTDVRDRFGQLDVSITKIKQREGSENVSSYLQAVHAQLEKIQQGALRDRQLLSSALEVLQQEVTQTRQAVCAKETELSAALSSVSAALQKESQHSREEFSSSLAALSQDLQDVTSAITRLQQEAKEDHDTYTTTATALQTAVQDVQHASITSIENLSSQAHVHTAELQALRHSVGSKTIFWNSILIMAAMVGAVSTLYFTMFKS